MLNIGSEVFSNLKNNFPQSLKEQYPDLSFTTASNKDEESNYPKVYFHQLPAVEVGQDLSGLTINGAQFTFQIEVADNESDSRANEVMNAVVSIMKGMRFSISQFPENQNTSSTYVTVARFTRVVGAGDVL